MFSIIRVIIFVIIFLIGILILKKSSLIHKKKFRVVLIVICVILTTILSLFPIENVFVTFSTPEAAFEYFHSCPAIFTVNGEKTYDSEKNLSGDFYELQVLLINGTDFRVICKDVIFSD